MADTVRYSVSFVYNLKFNLPLFQFIFRSQQYVYLYPEHRIDVQNHDVDVAIADRKILQKVIPPFIETIIPEKAPEKHGTDEKDTIMKEELQPTKPFYYVLPPQGSQFIYYNPQIQLIPRKIQPF